MSTVLNYTSFRLRRFVITGTEQNRRQAVKRMGVDTALGSIDLLDITRSDDLPGCSLSMHSLVIYQD